MREREIEQIRSVRTYMSGAPREDLVFGRSLRYVAMHLHLGIFIRGDVLGRALP